MENIIAKYKKHIRQTGLDDELYKWRLIKQFQGRPDLLAENFGENIFHINYENLLYKLAKGVLNDIAKNRPEELRLCFKNLFDENLDLKKRITQFSDNTLVIYREWVDNFYHHQDERTISTYLTFYNPDKYALYKNAFYKKYCDLLGIKTKEKWNKYIHYLELINDFKDRYIETDPELIQMVNSLKTEDCYEDKNHLILAQDILYQMLEKLDEATPSYWAAGFHWKDDNEKDINKLNEFIDNGIWQIGWQRDQKEGAQYYKLIDKVKEGDYILLKTYGGKHDLTVFGIGQVTDTTNVNDGIFAVEWTIKTETYKGKAPSGAGSGNWQGTFLEVKRPDDINLLFNKAMEVNKEAISSSDTQSFSLNQILYGPPGTGKTYNSINHAVAIVEGRKIKEIENESQADRSSVLDRFRKYKELGQIVFTTFHQSMCYEDFIEGIKPYDVDGKLHYEVKEGIFKTISDKALLNFQNFNNKNSKQPFEVIWNDFLKPLIEGETIKVSMKKSSFYITDVNDRTIFFDKDSGDSKHSLSVATLKAMYLQGENHVIKGGLQPYYEPLLNELLNKTKEANQEELKRYVLIIDEINRGNVSQIFGELITLIEDDKRLGKPEELTVTLPYSKNRDFGVPSNLYLIGTMNTADRSVEALDAALRRRFTFIEMAPEPSLIKDFGVLINYKSDELIYPEVLDDMVRLLEVINDRIERLLDKDHMIGHSYFMSVASVDDLKCVFQHKIIPLLQEYFYGDIAKIGLVLGVDFFEKLDNTNNVTFADFPHEAKSDLLDRKVFRLKKEWENDEEFLAAVKKIVGK